MIVRGHHAKEGMMRMMLVLLLALVMEISATAQRPTALTAGDYAEIQQIYARYAHGIDASNRQMLASVFTADAEFVMGSKVTKASDFGRGEMRERALARHVTTSILIEPTEGGARGTAYVMLVNLQSTPPMFMGGGVYEDLVVKTADGWRFKKRTYFEQSTPPPGAKPVSR
jgi:hypothetical protein